MNGLPKPSDRAARSSVQIRTGISNKPIFKTAGVSITAATDGHKPLKKMTNDFEHVAKAKTTQHTGVFNKPLFVNDGLSTTAAIGSNPMNALRDLENSVARSQNPKLVNSILRSLPHDFEKTRRDTELSDALTHERKVIIMEVLKTAGANGQAALAAKDWVAVWRITQRDAAFKAAFPNATAEMIAEIMTARPTALSAQLQQGLTEQKAAIEASQQQRAIEHKETVDEIVKSSQERERLHNDAIAQQKAIAAAQEAQQKAILNEQKLLAYQQAAEHEETKELSKKQRQLLKQSLAANAALQQEMADKQAELEEKLATTNAALAAMSSAVPSSVGDDASVADTLMAPTVVLDPVGVPVSVPAAVEEDPTPDSAADERVATQIDNINDSTDSKHLKSVLKRLADWKGLVVGKARDNSKENLLIWIYNNIPESRQYIMSLTAGNKSSMKAAINAMVDSITTPSAAAPPSDDDEKKDEPPSLTGSGMRSSIYRPSAHTRLYR